MLVKSRVKVAATIARHLHLLVPLALALALPRVSRPRVAPSSGRGKSNSNEPVLDRRCIWLLVLGVVLPALAAGLGFAEPATAMLTVVDRIKSS